MSSSILAKEIDNAVLKAASNRGLRGLTEKERLALIDQKLSGVRRGVLRIKHRAQIFLPCDEATVQRKLDEGGCTELNAIESGAAQLYETLKIDNVPE